MSNFIWTQFTPGHIAIPVMENGKVKMNIPDAAAVKAATDANIRHDAHMRRSLKETMQHQQKRNGNKGTFIKNIDAAVATARIAPKVRIPRAEPVVTDIMLVKNRIYDLPADNKRVKEYVASGHLQVYIAPAPVTNDPLSANPANK